MGKVQQQRSPRRAVPANGAAASPLWVRVPGELSIRLTLVSCTTAMSTQRGPGHAWTPMCMPACRCGTSGRADATCAAQLDALTQRDEARGMRVCRAQRGSGLRRIRRGACGPLFFCEPARADLDEVPGGWMHGGAPRRGDPVAGAEARSLTRAGRHPVQHPYFARSGAGPGPERGGPAGVRHRHLFHPATPRP
jgi:hypothetical protein